MKRPATQMTLAEMREPIPSAPHPPLVLDRKTKKRDEVLEALGMDESRALMIQIATEIAVSICRKNGWVTSVQVMLAMRERSDLVAMLDALDPRWIAAVLLPSKGWVRIEGTINIGSRGRPVARWTRKP